MKVQETQENLKSHSLLQYGHWEGLKRHRQVLKRHQFHLVCSLLFKVKLRSHPACDSHLETH